MKNKTLSTFCDSSPVISGGKWSRMALLLKKLPAPVLNHAPTKRVCFFRNVYASSHSEPLQQKADPVSAGQKPHIVSLKDTLLSVLERFRFRSYFVVFLMYLVTHTSLKQQHTIVVTLFGSVRKRKVYTYLFLKVGHSPSFLVPERLLKFMWV